MAILNFQKPDKIALQKTTEFEAQFEFRPLEPGYGVTIGNALRRVLLSSLEGYAITAIRIPGADHEFATLKGVLEDVTEIILNLKQVRLKAFAEVGDFQSERVELIVKGKDTFTAGMINDVLPNFQVMNPGLVICNMQPGTVFQIELYIGKGRGYVPAEDNRPEDAPLGFISIDSIFTPIKNVKHRKYPCGATYGFREIDHGSHYRWNHSSGNCREGRLTYPDSASDDHYRREYRAGCS